MLWSYDLESYMYYDLCFLKITIFNLVFLWWIFHYVLNVDSIQVLNLYLNF